MKSAEVDEVLSKGCTLQEATLAQRILGLVILEKVISENLTCGLSQVHLGKIILLIQSRLKSVNGMRSMII